MEDNCAHALFSRLVASGDEWIDFQCRRLGRRELQLENMRSFIASTGMTVAMEYVMHPFRLRQPTKRRLLP